MLAATAVGWIANRASDLNGIEQLMTTVAAFVPLGSRLEIAQQMANHESAPTTGLDDRRSDDVSLDEVERIGI